MQILETERLRLRWFDDRDIPFVLGLVNETPWKTNISDPGISTLEQARQWMQDRLQSRYWSQGHGFWCIERKEDGEPLGLCGLIHRDGLPEPDLGYGLAERHWGRGYAREAAAAALRYAHEVLGLRHLLATTAPHNDASGSVLRDIGFADLGLQHTEAHEGLSHVYEWKAPTDAGTDEAQIEALVRRVATAADNQGGRLHTLAALPCWLLTEARIVQRSASAVQSIDVRAYAEPLSRELNGGTMQDIVTHVEDLRIKRDGGIAQVRLHTRRTGRRNGEPFEQRSLQLLQCVRVAQGWKLTSLLSEAATA